MRLLAATLAVLLFASRAMCRPRDSDGSEEVEHELESYEHGSNSYEHLEVERGPGPGPKSSGHHPDNYPIHDPSQERRRTNGCTQNYFNVEGDILPDAELKDSPIVATGSAGETKVGESPDSSALRKRRQVFPSRGNVGVNRSGLGPRPRGGALDHGSSTRNDDSSKVKYKNIQIVEANVEDGDSDSEEDSSYGSYPSSPYAFSPYAFSPRFGQFPTQFGPSFPNQFGQFPIQFGQSFPTQFSPFPSQFGRYPSFTRGFSRGSSGNGFQ